MQHRVQRRQQMLAESLLLQLGDILGVKLRLHSDVAGDRWVSECAQEFVKAHGNEAVKDVSKRQLPYDLVVSGLRVQCKARTPKRGRSMSIGKWWGRSKYAGDCFDFLALKYGESRYVIPRSALTRADGAFKNDISPDRFWRYRDQWALSGATDNGINDVSCPLFSIVKEPADGR